MYIYIHVNLLRSLNKKEKINDVEGHGSSGSTVYVGIDTTSGELVTISEWVLKWRHYGRKKILRKDDVDEDKEGTACLKQVGLISCH